MLYPYAAQTVIFSNVFFSSDSDYFRVIIGTSPLSESLTRHNSADSVPTSNLVRIKEVAIRTILCITGLIYYTCNLVTDIQCTRYKNAFKKRF